MTALPRKSPSAKGSHAKALSENPLKMSPALGASLAILGLEGSVPLLHGAQGCTAFGLVIMVRHFKEPIPIQTTAMSELTTILGGADNLEQAVLTLKSKLGPKVIGVCSTGLTATRGEDLAADLKRIAAEQAETLDGTRLIGIDTPDYAGGLEDGWSRAVTAMIDQVARPNPGPRDPKRIALLAGCHLSAGDIDELRDLAEAFGLEATVVPDLADSLDGHLPPAWPKTTPGGTRLQDIETLGAAGAVLALGRHMEPAARLLEDRTGCPALVLPNLTGLTESDRLVATLARLSGRPVPARLRRQRDRLRDTLLDAHFHTGDKGIAVAAEPDLLAALVGLVESLGARITAAVAPQSGPALEEIKAPVTIGDLGDLEDMVRAAPEPCHLIISHSHGRHPAQALGLPLLRAGFPQFDRIGAQHQVSVGYRGTQARVVELANLFIDHPGDH
ncbi:nitrogenase iron-molybdenum cofactor biosynthesis protein NifN [Roseospirillum parvum]|uniref:Nitrogenase iron-molybdenum cofactor biosynthesis protein NifN n=1 Tax=Roseospirillum parvum TaxID=83401 RepID=A0A1G8G9Z3_9PROT|nr:nitrogenase iron-molybdenum cofactor biosynthesis protein NifN [Roseospirillum parvum]SDH91218.1 nitrogenase molybdenum-iron protein NifN [Roseospirillum parvum]